jgi:SAM-dependent methyltransferase
MLETIKRLLASLSGHFTGGSEDRAGQRFCPVCEKHSRRFKPFGAIKRKEARCPVCGALERHRLVWLYLQRKTGLFQQELKGTMLHVAPESILESKFRRLLGKHYLTADYLKSKVDVKMDIMNIAYPDRSFEVIYCSHVLEHVPDDRRAMREFKRVLVPITAERTFEDPSIVDPNERLRLFGQEDHVRRYGPDYADRLREAGFEVERIRPSDFLSPAEIAEMAITSAGDIYLCRPRNG